MVTKSESPAPNVVIVCVRSTRGHHLRHLRKPQPHSSALLTSAGSFPEELFIWTEPLHTLGWTFRYCWRGILSFSSSLTCGLRRWKCLDSIMFTWNKSDHFVNFSNYPRTRSSPGWYIPIQGPEDPGDLNQGRVRGPGYLRRVQLHWAHGHRVAPGARHGPREHLPSHMMSSYFRCRWTVKETRPSMWRSITSGSVLSWI